MSEIEIKKRWYVVHAYSGNESKVKQQILDMMVRHHVESKFGDILVPTEEVVEMRSGQKRKSQRKFFPGYVLVEMVLDDDTWYLIKNIPGVLGFIGGAPGSKPAPLSQKEVDTILQQLEATVDKPRPKVLFEVGEVVRVADGPFADFSGVVEEVNYEKSRLRVAVLIFGRSTPVDLEFSQVEKV
jgi:transcriptional antiterminator NusG